MRKLTKNEKKLVKALLSSKGEELLELLPVLDVVNVENADNGGMGGVVFLSDDQDRSFGDVVAEAQFYDSDGIVVSVGLNTDDKGNLFELDIWKVDYSQLKSWPDPTQLNFDPAHQLE